jgi:hypothetical protein
MDPYPDPDSQSGSGVETRIRYKSSYYAIIACKNIGNWKLKNGVRCRNKKTGKYSREKTA